MSHLRPGKLVGWSGPRVATVQLNTGERIEAKVPMPPYKGDSVVVDLEADPPRIVQCATAKQVLRVTFPGDPA